MNTLIYKLYETNDLSEEEIYYLLLNMNSECEKQLFNFADITRRKFYKNNVYLRGLIEFSSFCKNTCKYCGLRKQNINLKRFRMTKEQIIDCCSLGYKLGIRTFVLQSGEDNFFADSILIQIISDIKKRFPDTAVTLSIGERKKESYKNLFDAGVDRYLLRHETIDKDLYHELHPTMSFESRINCLNDLLDIGYQTGSGFIVGLPGQTDKILAQDLTFLKKIHPHMIGLGPFIPHKDTPLAKIQHGSIEKTLICMAIARLLVPDALMPVTTALAVLNPDKGWGLGLNAGANVIMPNLTPTMCRNGYEIYDGKSELKDNAGKDLKQIEAHIQNAGFIMDMGRGDHILWS